MLNTTTLNTTTKTSKDLNFLIFEEIPVNRDTATKFSVIPNRVENHSINCHFQEVSVIVKKARLNEIISLAKKNAYLPFSLRHFVFQFVNEFDPYFNSKELASFVLGLHFFEFTRLYLFKFIKNDIIIIYGIGDTETMYFIYKENENDAWIVLDVLKPKMILPLLIN